MTYKHVCDHNISKIIVCIIIVIHTYLFTPIMLPSFCQGLFVQSKEQYNAYGCCHMCLHILLGEAVHK